MPLQYYDTFWDDTIIPSQYHSLELVDVTKKHCSPGVKNIPILLSERLLQEDEFRNYLPTQDFLKWKEGQILQYINDNIKSGSFLGLLFETSQAAGNLQQHTNTTDYLLSVGVNYDIEKSTLSEYLKNHPNYSLNSKNVDEDNVSTYTIRNEIISFLQQGEPVIVGGSVRKNMNSMQDNQPMPSENDDLSDGGHVCIAYSYDERNDIIYGNLGWGADDVHRDLDSFFLNINDYYHININQGTEHIHNHRYYDFNNEIICSCKLSCHNHLFKFCSLNNLSHGNKCFCGLEASSEPHDFEYTTYYGGAPWKKCKICGFSTFNYKN